MTRKEIARRYMDAWNRQDVDALLDLMHEGAVYYDSFWMESCIASNLPQYFRDSFDEEPYFYVQVGEPIETNASVFTRYCAHHRDGSELGEEAHYGAEILHIVDNKILTVTDVYGSFVESDLLALAEISEQRHGVPKYADEGLGSLKVARIKAALASGIEEQETVLHADTTISQLAEYVGCTLDQLSAVLESQFGKSFEEFVDLRRIDYARHLMESGRFAEKDVDTLAASAGFRTTKDFLKKFSDVTGHSATSFLATLRRKKPANDNSDLH